MPPEWCRSRAAFLLSAALLVLLTLGACTPSIVPRGAPIEPAYIAPDAFVMEDGVRLPYKRWSPPGPAKAVVIALHGFNDYSGAYKDLGPLLAKSGLLVFAYDQRGFGATAMRGEWAGTAAMTADLATVADLLHAAHPKLKVYALGESMGGAVIMAALGGKHPPRIDGAVLSAPAVWGRSTMTWFERTMLTIGAHIAPRVHVRPQTLPKLPSDNIAMLRRLYYDPMMIKETRIGTAWGITTLMDDALVASPRIMAPLLVLYGKEDGIIPRGPTCKMLRTLPHLPETTPKWRLAIYEHGYHMLFRDLDGKLVSEDIAAWLQDSKAPLPSGSELGHPGAPALPSFCTEKEQ